MRSVRLIRITVNSRKTERRQTIDEYDFDGESGVRPMRGLFVGWLLNVPAT